MGTETRKYYAPKKCRYSIIAFFLILTPAFVYSVFWRVNVEKDSFYYIHLLFFLFIVIFSTREVFFPIIKLSPKGVTYLRTFTPWGQLKSVTITRDSRGNEYVFIEKETLWHGAHITIKRKDIGDYEQFIADLRARVPDIVVSR